MHDLKGKVAVVTGAAQGIGATFATALAPQGAKVVVTDVADTAKADFQKPTLVLAPHHRLRVVREEQFGPVLPIMPFESEDEAVQYAKAMKA